ncbi:hypothetical protein FOQG_01753 [Fusarium oxysporum f. sp. raphani 54005]|uniref:Uncharacterized protein n=2 Tax=Fusarium oxysporum TaxID=5507 RepID=X0D7K0_FUSOX|nr:hypothetical protein FOVG_09600 [Fusarium oxysporum f. sp. pisi HDV247]EXK99114.1 hypothetical protein FOQG_01753 [Fusarium oxysporum f. sp. raphani 54005]
MYTIRRINLSQLDRCTRTVLPKLMVQGSQEDLVNLRYVRRRTASSEPNMLPFLLNSRKDSGQTTSAGLRRGHGRSFAWPCMLKVHLNEIVRSCDPTGIFHVWDTYYHASG